MLILLPVAFPKKQCGREYQQVIKKTYFKLSVSFNSSFCAPRGGLDLFGDNSLNRAD